MIHVRISAICLSAATFRRIACDDAEDRMRRWLLPLLWQSVRSCRKRHRANSKYASIVIDANTGKTVYSRHADAHRFPASLTKIMTLYIVFEELNAGRLKKSSLFKVSKRASPASRRPNSGCVPGSASVSTMPSRPWLRSRLMMSPLSLRRTSPAPRAQVRQADDQDCAAPRHEADHIQECIGPAESQAAHDGARHGAARASRSRETSPSTTSISSSGRSSTRAEPTGSHNRLLGRYRGTDGIKTGYTRASGFNLTSSVRRGRQACDRRRHGRQNRPQPRPAHGSAAHQEPAQGIEVQEKKTAAHCEKAPAC